MTSFRGSVKVFFLEIIEKERCIGLINRYLELKRKYSKKLGFDLRYLGILNLIVTEPAGVEFLEPNCPRQPTELTLRP